MSGDDLERRLASLGDSQPPEPSSQYLTSLRGSTLRRQHVRRIVRLPVLLPAVAVAALVLGVVLLVGGDHSPSPDTVVVQTASDAVVDESGQVTDVQPGQTLPEGAEVRTGASGGVTVGAVTLGPAERAVVRDGRLRRIERKKEIESAPVVLQLDVRRGIGGRVAVRWSRYEGDDFAAYVVIRDGRFLTGRRNPDRTIAVPRVRPGQLSRYVVVVLDLQRHVIARSPVVEA